MIPLELYLGAIVAAVIVYGFWAVLKVLAATYAPDADVVEETETESEYLRAVSRAARS